MSGENRTSSGEEFTFPLCLLRININRCEITDIYKINYSLVTKYRVLYFLRQIGNN